MNQAPMNQTLTDQDPVSQAGASLRLASLTSHTSLIFTPFIFISLIFMSLMLSACQNPKSALIGEWVIDQDSFFQALRDPKVDPPAGVIAQELSEPMVNDWRFRFEPDQTLRMRVNGELHKGRYTVTKVISSTLYIKAETRPIYERSIDEALKLEPRRGEVEVNRLSLRISGESATLTYGDMEPLKLKRGGGDMLSLRGSAREGAN